MKDITQRHVKDDNYIYIDLDDERHNYGSRQVYLWVKQSRVVSQLHIKDDNWGEKGDVSEKLYIKVFGRSCVNTPILDNRNKF